MKKQEFRQTGYGDRMVIETGHRAFDRQCSGIFTGNHTGNTVVSAYIRAHSETECNDRDYASGHLQSWDLAQFDGLNNQLCIPPRIKAKVQELTKDCNGILYVFFHRRGRNFHGSAIYTTHCWVLTDERYRLLQTWKVGPTWKSHNILNGVLPYITKDCR